MTSVIALSNIDFLVGKASLRHEYSKGCATRTISSARGRCSNTLVFFVFIYLLHNMKFLRHENFVHLQLTMFHPTSLGYPPRKIRENFMHLNISCYAVYIFHI